MLRTNDRHKLEISQILVIASNQMSLFLVYIIYLLLLITSFSIPPQRAATSENEEE